MSYTPSGQDLEVLPGFIDRGAVTPVIDRSYPLAATADAFRHLATRHARGEIVITVRGKRGR